MRASAILTLLLSACATVPSEGGLHDRAVFEGYTVAEARRAAMATLNELSRFTGPARATEDGRVVTEYAANGWTSYEVRFEQLDRAVAVDVGIEARSQPSCPGRSARTFPFVALHALRGPAAREGEPSPRPTPILPRANLDRDCAFEAREVSTDRATEILSEIHARLTSDGEPALLSPSP